MYVVVCFTLLFVHFSFCTIVFCLVRNNLRLPFIIFSLSPFNCFRNSLEITFQSTGAHTTLLFLFSIEFSFSAKILYRYVSHKIAIQLHQPFNNSSSIENEWKSNVLNLFGRTPGTHMRANIYNIFRANWKSQNYFSFAKCEYKRGVTFVVEFCPECTHSQVTGSIRFPDSGRRDFFSAVPSKVSGKPDINYPRNRTVNLVTTMILRPP